MSQGNDSPAPALVGGNQDLVIRVSTPVPLPQNVDVYIEQQLQQDGNIEEVFRKLCEFYHLSIKLKKEEVFVFGAKLLKAAKSLLNPKQYTIFEFAQYSFIATHGKMAEEKTDEEKAHLRVAKVLGPEQLLSGRISYHTFQLSDKERELLELSSPNLCFAKRKFVTYEFIKSAHSSGTKVTFLNLWSAIVGHDYMEFPKIIAWIAHCQMMRYLSGKKKVVMQLIAADIQKVDKEIKALRKANKPVKLPKDVRFVVSQMREKGCTFHSCGLLIPGDIKDGDRFPSYDDEAVDASVLIPVYDDVAEEVIDMASNGDDDEDESDGGPPSTPTVEVATPGKAWTVGTDENAGSSVGLRRSNRAKEPRQLQQNGENAIVETPSRLLRRRARKAPVESDIEFSQLHAPLRTNDANASVIQDNESIDLGAEYDHVGQEQEEISEDKEESVKQTIERTDAFERRVSVAESSATVFPDRTQPTNFESAKLHGFDLDDSDCFNTFLQGETADNDLVPSPRAFTTDEDRVRDNSGTAENDSSCLCNYCVLVSQDPSKSLIGLLQKLNGPNGFEALMSALRTFENQQIEGFWWCQEEGYSQLSSALRLIHCMSPSGGLLELMEDLYKLVDNMPGERTVKNALTRIWSDSKFACYFSEELPVISARMEMAQRASAAYDIPQFEQREIAILKDKAFNAPTEAGFDFVSLSETSLTATGGKKALRCDHLLLKEIEMNVFHLDSVNSYPDQLIRNSSHSLLGQLVGFDPRVILFALSYGNIEGEFFSIPHPIKYTPAGQFPASRCYDEEGQGVIVEVLLRGEACELEYLLPGQSDYQTFAPAYLRPIAFPSGTLVRYPASKGPLTAARISVSFAFRSLGPFGKFEDIENIRACYRELTDFEYPGLGSPYYSMRLPARDSFELVCKREAFRDSAPVVRTMNYWIEKFNGNTKALNKAISDRVKPTWTTAARYSFDMFLMDETSEKVGGTSFVSWIGRDMVFTEGVPFENIDGTEDTDKTKAYKDLPKDKKGGKRNAQTAGIITNSSANDESPSTLEGSSIKSPSKKRKLESSTLASMDNEGSSGESREQMSDEALID